MYVLLYVGNIEIKKIQLLPSIQKAKLGKLVTGINPLAVVRQSNLLCEKQRLL